MAKSHFRTTENSDPAFGFEGLKFITVKSKNLLGRGDICVFVPEGKHENLPVVTLLHGVYGSCWVWALKGNAHGVARDLITSKKISPMILAMPSDGLWGDGSGYLPHGKQDFENWIAEDVQQAVLENVPEVSAQSKHFICGLSMGGFGALKIGSRHHQKFCAISAHSSITSYNQMSLFVEEEERHYRSENPELEDAFVSILNNRDHLPPLRFDCGTEDLLLDYNRKLHLQLEQEDISHIYEEFSGGHQWNYWQDHLTDSLFFFNQFV
ncbi:MAG: YqiA/YcfP family alpha/beta fold hydrolase [Bacteroidota bacterium]